MKNGCYTTIQKDENRGFIRVSHQQVLQNLTFIQGKVLFIWWDFKGVICYEILKLAKLLILNVTRIKCSN